VNTTPENTKDRDPLLHLMGALGSSGVSGYIEEMESAGQSQLIHSTSLPAEILHSTREEFEALGFVFGDQDDLFMQATLPEGWRKEGSDHAMWSHVVDERGLKRVNVFYKAAFYDRKAHMSLANVGRSLAADFLYGDEPVSPIPWHLLTDSETAAAVAWFDHMAEDIASHPDIYGRHADRLAAAYASVPA
jgi:hypothetical protein